MSTRFRVVDRFPWPTPAELARARADAGDGVVYFVQQADHGPIKIGYSQRTHLKARLSALQTGNPLPLALRHVAAGTRSTEHHLHRLFADLRIRGEWFWPDPDLAAVAHANPDPL